MDTNATFTNTSSLSTRRGTPDMELSNPLWSTYSTYYDGGSLKSVRITSKPLGMALWLVATVALLVGIVLALPFHVVVNVVIAVVVVGVLNIVSWLALLLASCVKCEKR